MLFQVKTEEPYVLEEKGWGEFDMRIVLYFTDNLTDPKVLTFDLNFAQSNYSKTHKVEFPNASPELIKLLARDPSVNTFSSRKGGKQPISSSNSKSKSKSNNDNNSNDNSSTSSSSVSRQTAKKRPASSAPHAKTAKKVKPEIIKHDLTKTKPEKYPKKISYSPTSLPRSPSFNDLSPAPNSLPSSSPAHSHITTATPDSADEKIVSSSPSNITIHDENTDHVYTMSDVYNLDPIHRAKLDEETRERWGIPEVKRSV